MEKIIFEIKDYIHETILLAVDFFKSLNLSVVLLTVAFLFILFLRKWAAKKIFSFSFTAFLLFILYIRIEALLSSLLGAEGSYYPVGIGRTVFLIVLGIVFFYYALLKE